MDDLIRWTTALADTDTAKRVQAAEELCQMGEGAQPAALSLVHASGDVNEEVREHAVAALEALGPPSPDIVSELAPLLSAESADVAYWAATLLGRLEAAAAAAVPALTAALGAIHVPAVRQRAAWALGRIGKSAAAALPELHQASADADSRFARLAHEACSLIRGDNT